MSQFVGDTNKTYTTSRIFLSNSDELLKFSKLIDVNPSSTTFPTAVSFHEVFPSPKIKFRDKKLSKSSNSSAY